MTPPPADPVRARASCVVIVAWRVPHPRVSVFREGGSGRPRLCVSMNKANLSVAGAARAGQGRAGLGWALDGGDRQTSRLQPASLHSLGPGTPRPRVRLTTSGLSSYPPAWTTWMDAAPPTPRSQAGTCCWQGGGLGRHLLDQKASTGGAGRKEAQCSRGAGPTGSHLKAQAAQEHRWLRARGLVCTYAGPCAPTRVYPPDRRAPALTRAARWPTSAEQGAHSELHAHREALGKQQRDHWKKLLTLNSPPPHTPRTLTCTYPCAHWPAAEKLIPEERKWTVVPPKKAEFGQPVLHPSRKSLGKFATSAEVS